MMKKISILLIAFVLVLEAKSQDAFTDNWNKAYNLVQEEKFAEAIIAFEPLLADQPIYSDTHVQLSWCHMMLKNQELALEHASTAYQLDQLNSSCSAMNSYLTYSLGMEYVGLIYLENAVWLMGDDSNLSSFEDDIANMEKVGMDVSLIKGGFEKIKSDFANRNRDWTAIYSSFSEGIELLNAADNEGAKVKFKETLNGFDAAPAAQQKLGYVTAYVISTYYYNMGDSTNYLPLLRASLEYMTENNKTSVMSIMHTITLLGEHYYNTAQYQKSFTVLSKGLDFLGQLAKHKYLTQYQAMFLTQYSLSANTLGNMIEARDASKMIIQLENTGFDEWYQTNGWYLLAQAWGEDAAKAKEYYQKAYDMAESNGFEELKNVIAENLK